MGMFFETEMASQAAAALGAISIVPAQAGRQAGRGSRRNVLALALGARADRLHRGVGIGRARQYGRDKKHRTD